MAAIKACFHFARIHADLTGAFGLISDNIHKGDLSKNNHFITLQIDGQSPNLFLSNYITKTEKSEASNDITN
jgi:hypothetical protein